MAKNKNFYISIKDARRMLSKAEKEFNSVNQEYFFGKAEEGEIDARSAQAYVGMYGSAIQTYVKIVKKLLSRLQDYKEKENDC